MKLIQLNVWAGAMGFSLLNYLRDLQADILTMQEVTSSPHGKTAFFSFLQNLQERAQFPHEFFAPTRDIQVNTKRVYHGNAILSRLELTQRHHEFTHLQYKEGWDIQFDDDNIRMFQHAAALSPEGKLFHVVNYHGFCQPKGVKTGNDDTVRHCRQIADYIAKLQGPVSTWRRIRNRWRR